jgi:hypothetical protein
MEEATSQKDGISNAIKTSLLTLSSEYKQQFTGLTYS